MLIGKSLTAWAARSSVDTKTGSFDGKNILQVAQEILAPYPVGIKTVGQIDLTPFVHLQNEKGELIWDFLERLARPRGIVMGSDSEGNFLLIGDHTFATVSELIEGQNIKSCQCTIRHEQTYQKYDAVAQSSGTDDRSGTEASEMFANVFSRIRAAAEQADHAGRAAGDLAGRSAKARRERARLARRHRSASDDHGAGLALQARPALDAR